MTVSVSGPDPAVAVAGLMEVTASGVVGDVAVDDEPPQPIRIVDATRPMQEIRQGIFFMTGNHKP